MMTMKRTCCAFYQALRFLICAVTNSWFILNPSIKEMREAECWSMWNEVLTFLLLSIPII